jgi:acetyl-CoA acetyltransferase
MSHHRVAIVAGARTPFVKAGKALASAGPSVLARHAVRGLLDRHQVDPDESDAIAFGVVVAEARALFQRGMALAMEWATRGLVVPHVSQTIDSTVEAINAGLQSLKAGRGILDKVAVIVDRDLAAGK